MIKATGTVGSADGTSIAYQQQGDGPVLIMVGGGLDDGSENAPLAAELADAFTVINYSRRGRGDSTDTAPYALERELEDLAALAAAAGPNPVRLFGASSGGALALEAAAAGLAVERVAVYEVPYLIGDEAVCSWRDYVADVTAIVADARSDDALARFMKLAGMGEADIEAARGSSEWVASSALAHTLPYDAACLGDGSPPERFADLAVPVLVIIGDQGRPLFEPAAVALAELLPNATRQDLDGQGHVADPAVLAKTVRGFLAG